MACIDVDLEREQLQLERDRLELETDAGQKSREEQRLEREAKNELDLNKMKIMIEAIMRKN